MKDDNLKTKEEIRGELTNFVEAERGEKLRTRLKEIAKNTYVSKYTPEEYIEFMNENEITFDINHPQSTNFPYYWSMFSDISQWVCGDCVEECLDKAIDEQDKQEPIPDGMDIINEDELKGAYFDAIKEEIKSRNKIPYKG